ncbi:MAG: glycosyltransferase family 87 protein [Thermoguttaceae bacterium]
MKRILGVPGRALEFLRVVPLQASLTLWIALFVVVGIKNLVYPDIHNVYPCYEEAARLWLTGRDLYDPQIMASGYRYGPAFAFSIIPLAVMPSALGSLLWNWLNFGLFFATVWKLIERGLPGDWTSRHKAFFLNLVLLGTTRTIWSGQCNLLVFSLVALAMLAIQDQRWWWAAALLAIPVHIKVWPLVPALLLIACWPRKLALRFPAAMLAIAAAPLLTKPWGWVWRQYVGWYDLLVGPAQFRHTYRDVWTLWEVIHEPVDARIYMLLQLLTGAAVLGLCLWQVRRGLPIQRRLLFVLVSWAVWQMTFGPATERTTFGLIAPLSAWGLATAFQQRRRRLLMTVAFVLMTCGNFGVIERALMDSAPIILAAHPVGAMLFFAWFLDWNHRTTDGPAPAAFDSSSVASCYSVTS